MLDPVCLFCGQEQVLTEIISAYADSDYEWQCLNPKCPGDKTND